MFKNIAEADKGTKKKGNKVGKNGKRATSKVLGPQRMLPHCIVLTSSMTCRMR